MEIKVDKIIEVICKAQGVLEGLNKDFQYETVRKTIKELQAVRESLRDMQN